MRKMVRWSLLAAAACLPTAAQAQTATGGAPEQSTEPTAQTEPAEGGLGDVVVTARKITERLQDVPAAITAFDTREIQSARIESIADVAKLTPGLNFTPAVRSPEPAADHPRRGADLRPAERGCVPGRRVPGRQGGRGPGAERSGAGRGDRGPQSALYGRNTFAGAINYITKRPTAELSSRAEITQAATGLFKSQLSVSGPITDTLRVRVGAYARTFDGFYRSAIDGGRVDFEDSYGGIATVEWQPSEPLIVTLRATYSNDRLGQPASSVIRNNSAPGPAFAGAPPASTRNLLFTGEVPAIPRNGVLVSTGPSPACPAAPFGDREESIRGNAIVEYDFGPALLTSITAYAKRNAEFTFDGDNTICDPHGRLPQFRPAHPVRAQRVRAVVDGRLLPRHQPGAPAAVVGPADDRLAVRPLLLRQHHGQHRPRPEPYRDGGAGRLYRVQPALHLSAHPADDEELCGVRVGDAERHGPVQHYGRTALRI
jgi:iron complex outermembrane receptor protein